MESIKEAPRRAYSFLSSVIEMIILFFLSIFYLSKPSDSLKKEDIDGIRHRRRPGNDGDTAKRRGQGGNHYIPMGGCANGMCG
jgi:hypothetical protein